MPERTWRDTLPCGWSAEAVNEEGDVHVALAGDLDRTRAGLLAEFLGRVIDGKPRLVLIDMTGVEFVDVAAYRVLAGAADRLEDRGGALRLYGLQAGPRRLIDIAQPGLAWPTLR